MCFNLKGEIFQANVEKLVNGGAGLLHYEGQSIFMENTVPGDVVIGRIREKCKGFSLADLVEIVSESQNRVLPVCPLYGVCGGCSLQHISYEKQILEKKAILKELIIHIGGINNPPAISVFPSEAFEYRNRVQFHRIGKDIGFKEKNSDKIIVINDCPIADKGIRKALIEKRIKCPPEKDRFAVFSYKKTFLSEGEEKRGKVSLLNRDLTMNVGVFFQSNVALLERVIEKIISITKTVDNDLPVADFYCGIGTFASFLQDSFKQIDLIEENKDALLFARENVRGERVTCSAISVDEWVRVFLKKNKKTNYSFLIVDPPRQGLSPLFRKWLSESGPPLLVYLSCDPATLARDTRELTRAYDLSEINFYDFYPQTAHIESLSLFSRHN